MTNLIDTETKPETLDIYRGAHKGIRVALFGLCQAAGALDPADQQAREAFVARFADLDLMLTSHHEHEDAGPFGEMIGRLAAADVDELEAGHRAFVENIASLREAVIGLGGGGTDADDLYDRIVVFVTDYLGHMAFEEQVVMPTIAAQATFDELLAVQIGIRSTIPPPDMCVFMRSMLPAMNPDERTGMLGGMKEAPPEVFDLFWATAVDVLTAAELAIVSARLEETPPTQRPVAR